MLPDLSELAKILGGSLEGAPPDQTPAGVTTDSRQVRPGDLFIALSGERFDGHDYVAAAVEAGALAAVVSRRPRPAAPGLPLLVVEDTLRAYGTLAHWRRRRMPARLAAVTGSAGKTTTKNLLGSLLSAQAPTLVASGTENNEIGVPKTLLQLTPAHRFCVVELAMRARGEIAYLAGLCEPEVGIITNIGTSHLGRLGSREAIAQSKAELLAALPPAGRAVLPAADFFFPLLAEMAPCPILSFGLSEEAEVRAQKLELRGAQGSAFELCLGTERLPVELPLPGRHMVLNALAAVAGAWALTGSTEGFAEALAAAETAAWRSQILELPGPVTVINDAYNASPSSVAAALELLAQFPGRRVLVLGDMLELGEFAEAEHRKAGALAAESGVALLIGVGPAAACAARAAGERGVETATAASTGEAVALLRERLQPGDTALVKGSRGMALEQVVEGLRQVRG